MIPDGLDPLIISKITSQQTEQVTCIECCKYYIAPETAKCGHSLCHSCWIGRRSCPVCASPLDRRALRLNLPLQTLTEHVHALGDAFEKLFNMTLDEFALELAHNKKEAVTDPGKNVKEWLASSQNHFSGPIMNSQQFTQDHVQAEELSRSKIQIHTHNNKEKSSSNVVELQQNDKSSILINKGAYPQDDWDKIEILPDTEDNIIKNKENIDTPVDMELFSVDDNNYTTNHPRRSSRRKEIKTLLNVHADDVLISTDRHSSKNSSSETEKKSVKSKQIWNNVKKMRKEFSKLNKKNKSRLNVSIEMCKKAQVNNKPSSIISDKTSQQPVYIIDDNTPNIKDDEEAVPLGNEKKSSDESHKNSDEFINIANKENIVLDKTQNNNSTNTQTENGIQSMEKDKQKCHHDDSNIIKNDSNHAKMPFVKKGILHQNMNEEGCVKITQSNVPSNIAATNTDDIEISIKVGNTITNITIKKKPDNSQVKISTDREIQTSLSPIVFTVKNNAACSPIYIANVENKESKAENILPKINRTISTKKNTDSADTATAHFEITESVEKELSDLMECVETNNSKHSKCNSKSIENIKGQVCDGDSEEVNLVREDDLVDLDIFNSGSINEQGIDMLKNTNHSTSEVMVPTLKSKKSQKSIYKRNRDIDDTVMPLSKKQRNNENTTANSLMNPKVQANSEVLANDSENMNYDVIMSQVFANIDADIKEKSHTEISSKLNKSKMIMEQTQNKTNMKHSEMKSKILLNSQVKEHIDEKYSENIFSMMDKDSETLNLITKGLNQPPGLKTQQNIEKLLTPGMCQDLASSHADIQVHSNDVETMESTPLMDHDDSDNGVVEDTPQKNLSFSKAKAKSDVPIKLNSNKQNESKNGRELSKAGSIKSVINISDVSQDFNKPKDVTVVEIIDKKTSETPLTINKFVNQIKHNSTPVARKSLNFDSENIQDLEQTLCPTTTQEKEFITKAFEQTPKSPIQKMPADSRNVNLGEVKRFCVAGSCLTASEIANVKTLCRNRGWSYIDKYTNDLTHLVVGVDSEKKSQRSVKYMCALAASKWIVTYTWVQTCLQMKNVVDEAPHEALDACGEPGPRRSRIAQKKLFEGMKFYCMPPYSILDVKTLQHILEAAGGHVMSNPEGVKVTTDNDGTPLLLLAEPEHTQEDRYAYIAIQLSIVPVNYEWVLNCLGAYTLSSFYDQLLCPPTLLPPVTKKWPEILLRETEYDD